MAQMPMVSARTQHPRGVGNEGNGSVVGPQKRPIKNDLSLPIPPKMLFLIAHFPQVSHDHLLQEHHHLRLLQMTLKGERKNNPTMRTPKV
jgi:hypothetical protein